MKPPPAHLLAAPRVTQRSALRPPLFTMLLCALCAGLVLASAALAGQARKAADTRTPRSAPRATSKPVPQAVELLSSSTADLPAMRQRGQVRVLVTPNRTNFTMAQDGSFRGLEHGLALQLERSLNKGLKKGQGMVRVVFVPVLRDELLPALLEGRGDVAAAGLTVTPEREALVAFSRPYFENVREVLVSRPDAPPLRSPDELAGRTIHMVASGSYAEHLQPLRDDFVRRGLPALTLIQADHVLETENLLEMLSAGLLENVASDEHIARLWAQVLPGLTIQPQTLAQGGRIAWAVRKDNPLLLAAVNKALEENAKNQAALINANFPGTRKDAQKRLANPFLAPKTASLVPDFQQRSDEYGFDWLHMMAQGFQESGLDNSARSRSGAVGVMQVLPATGASLGFKDIRPAPTNIHAGVRYMSKMRDEETSGDGLDPEQRFYFALASYNVGPARVRKLREQARSEGLDPDVWFGSVERVALRQGCQGAVIYVRNIRAYYIAYSLSWDIHLRRVKVSQDGSAASPAQAPEARP